MLKKSKNHVIMDLSQRSVGRHLGTEEAAQHELSGTDVWPPTPVGNAEFQTCPHCYRAGVPAMTPFCPRCGHPMIVGYQKAPCRNWPLPSKWIIGTVFALRTIWRN